MRGCKSIIDSYRIFADFLNSFSRNQNIYTASSLSLMKFLSTFKECPFCCSFCCHQFCHNRFNSQFNIRRSGVGVVETYCFGSDVCLSRICVRSVALLSLEGYSTNLANMLTTLTQCAECMSHWPPSKIKVTPYVPRFHSSIL